MRNLVILGQTVLEMYESLTLWWTAKEWRTTADASHGIKVTRNQPNGYSMQNSAPLNFLKNTFQSDAGNWPRYQGHLYLYACCILQVAWCSVSQPSMIICLNYITMFRVKQFWCWAFRLPPKHYGLAEQLLVLCITIEYRPNTLFAVAVYRDKMNQGRTEDSFLW